MEQCVCSSKAVWWTRKRFKCWVEAAALRASIAGTEWSSAIDKSHRAGHASVYTVAQYNDPFEYENVNEIWFLFEMESERHAM